MRNKKVRKNIENMNLSMQKSLYSVNKNKLSSYCELFPKIINNFELYKKGIKSRKKSLFMADTKSTNSIQSDCENNINTKKTNAGNKQFLTNSICQSNNLTNKTIHHTENQKNVNKGLSKNYINFIYNKIFPNYFKPKKNVINNKLNIFYAENETQFNQNMEKLNKYLKKQGKFIKHVFQDSKLIDNKVLQIKKSVGFIKGVSDCSYPSISLHKIKLRNKLNSKYKKRNKILLPYEEAQKEADEKNSIKTKLITQLLQIYSQKKSSKLRLNC
jgi:hypothetical protein